MQQGGPGRDKSDDHSNPGTGTNDHGTNASPAGHDGADLSRGRGPHQDLGSGSEVSGRMKLSTGPITCDVEAAVPVQQGGPWRDGGEDSMPKAGWMSGDHTPPPQIQAGGMSGDHSLPPQQLVQQDEDIIYSLREPVPGPGGSIEADSLTANDQRQHPPNANFDEHHVGKMHPPWARQQQHQQLQQPVRVSIAGPPGGSLIPLQLDHSSNGPPPVHTTSHVVGGGHPAKRVSTDTLSPPCTKRRSTGTGPQ